MFNKFLNPAIWKWDRKPRKSAILAHCYGGGVCIFIKIAEKCWYFGIFRVYYQPNWEFSAFEHVFRDLAENFNHEAYTRSVLHRKNGHLATSNQLQITPYLLGIGKNDLRVLDRAENCLSNGIKTNSSASIGTEIIDFEFFKKYVKNISRF